MNAEMILKALPENTMNLSTVYRNLEKLSENGIVSKSIIENTAYYHANDDGHHHYIICTKCKKMSELDCHIGSLSKAIEKSTKFKVLQHDLTFYGICRDCQA